jgi:hypothetical protein
LDFETTAGLACIDCDCVLEPKTRQVIGYHGLVTYVTRIAVEKVLLYPKLSRPGLGRLYERRKTYGRRVPKWLRILIFEELRLVRKRVPGVRDNVPTNATELAQEASADQGINDALSS